MWIVNISKFMYFMIEVLIEDDINDSMKNTDSYI